MPRSSRRKSRSQTRCRSYQTRSRKTGQCRNTRKRRSSGLVPCRPYQARSRRSGICHNKSDSGSKQRSSSRRRSGSTRRRSGSSRRRSGSTRRRRSGSTRRRRSGSSRRSDRTECYDFQRRSRRSGRCYNPNPPDYPSRCTLWTDKEDMCGQDPSCNYNELGVCSARPGFLTGTKDFGEPADGMYVDPSDPYSAAANDYILDLLAEDSSSSSAPAPALALARAPASAPARAPARANPLAIEWPERWDATAEKNLYGGSRHGRGSRMSSLSADIDPYDVTDTAFMTGPDTVCKGRKKSSLEPGNCNSVLNCHWSQRTPWGKSSCGARPYVRSDGYNYSEADFE